MEEWEKDGMEGAKGMNRKRAGENGGVGQSCLFWSIQASALFDEDEVKS